MQEEKDRKTGFFQFLISKKFFIQLAVALGILVVIFFILTRYLAYYSSHGKEMSVPDFYGLTVSEIDSAGFSEDYDFFVIDSLYDADSRKGMVVIQNPLPGTQVKKGRNIYSVPLFKSGIFFHSFIKGDFIPTVFMVGRDFHKPQRRECSFVARLN